MFFLFSLDRIEFLQILPKRSNVACAHETKIILIIFGFAVKQYYKAGGT